MPWGGFFEKNCSPSIPSGKRCSDTGRSPLARDERLPDLDEVLRQVELGDARLREDHPAGTGDAHLPVAVGPGNREDDRIACHATTVPPEPAVTAM